MRLTDSLAGKSNTEEFKFIYAHCSQERNESQTEKKFHQTLHAEKKIHVCNEPTWREMPLRGIHKESNLTIGPINSTLSFHNQFQQQQKTPLKI